MKESVHWSGTSVRVYRPVSTWEAGTGGVICGNPVTRVEFADVEVGALFPVLMFLRRGSDC